MKWITNMGKSGSQNQPRKPKSPAWRATICERFMLWPAMSTHTSAKPMASS